MIDVAELAAIPFLKGVPEKELTSWARVAQPREVERREELFASGDPIDSLMLVRHGLIFYCLQTAVGETRMTAIIDSQQCLNIGCLHPQTRHTMSAVALTEASLISIPARAAREAVERGGRLARVLAGYCAAWATSLADEFIRATTQDVRTRAATALVRLMDALGSDEIPLSQEQIAHLIGTRRETLALTLGDMRREKIVDTRYRRIRILNRQALVDDTRGSYPTVIANAVPIPITGPAVLVEA